MMPPICIPHQQPTDPLSSLPDRQMEEVLSLNEDYIFLRKVQKCQTGEDQKSTLLDCEKVLKGFQDLQCKVDRCWVDTTPAEGGGRLPGTHKAPPKAFLKSWGYRTRALFYTFFTRYFYTIDINEKSHAFFSPKHGQSTSNRSVPKVGWNGAAILA